MSQKLTTHLCLLKDNIHMVTVGDKIAWWCLDHLPRKKAPSIINQRARKTSVPADTYNPFQRRRRTSESNVAVISPGKIFF